ncbi:MAG TPA: PIN domain-containing protein [Dehalococcoidia bacterium]|nr:PIN domain-containing protein [Dehalococcoidia bacterium]
MADDAPLLDTNVILRHVTQDSPELSPRATAIITRLGTGELRARILDQALFEAAFTLLGMYEATREELQTTLQGLIDLPGVIVRSKAVWEATLDIFADSKLSLVDAYHVAIARQSGIGEIISFDTDFDNVPGIKRIAP